MPKPTKKITKKIKKPSKVHLWWKENSWVVAACVWVLVVLTALVVSLVKSIDHTNRCDIVGGAYIDGYCIDVKTLDF